MEARPWLQNYPSGVPANIDADAYANLVEFLENSFDKFRKNQAYIYMGKSLTFNQVDKMSTAFAAYLQSRGLDPGDKIAIMMPNMLQYPIALFGCVKAGLIIVNTNPLYTPREMEYQFVDSGAKAIIIAENFAANLEKIIAKTNIKTIITTSVGELLSFGKKQIVNFVVRNVKKMVPKYNLPNSVTFSTALKQGSQFTLNIHRGKPDDTIVIQYTGGTTGVSKGAELTNRNLVANVMQVKAIIDPLMDENKEVALCALPLYHIFAFTVNCLAMMLKGASNLLIINARDLDSLIKDWKKTPVSVMTGVNTLFNALMNKPSFQEMDFSKLKVSLGGGMAVQTAVAERWHDMTGCYLAQGYGLTETSPVASVNPFDGTGRLGYIGLPVPSTDMRIMKENGEVGQYNEIGEIQIKGPQVMKGYYNRPDATAEVIDADGWFSSGDVGIMEEDGFFKIVDRKKDMILVSGFNVYPNEVEDAIAMHPKILEVAAIGIPDEKSTEAVKIFVVKKDDSLTKEELRDYCKEVLTGYKRPKQIEFRKDLPKSNVGKILRRVLKDEVENQSQ